MAERNIRRYVIRYRWTCKSDSNRVIEVSRAMADRDVLPTREELDDDGFTDLSPYEFERRLETPRIMKRHIPSMGRGGRFVRDGKMRDLREAGKLEQESFDMHHSERGEIEKEIDKLEKVEDNV